MEHNKHKIGDLLYFLPDEDDTEPDDVAEFGVITKISTDEKGRQSYDVDWATTGILGKNMDYQSILKFKRDLKKALEYET